MSTTPTPPPDPSDEVVAAMISHTVNLQARCDALYAMVEILATRQGIDPKLFRKKLLEIAAACEQKRLERIEDQSASGAAKIDRRGDTPDIDPDILGGFQFGDEGGKP